MFSICIHLQQIAASLTHTHILVSLLVIQLESKGYKLYDITKQQLFVSRDVLFFENLFPFHTTQQKEVLPPFLETFVLPKSLSDIGSMSCTIGESSSNNGNSLLLTTVDRAIEEFL